METVQAGAGRCYCYPRRRPGLAVERVRDERLVLAIAEILFMEQREAKAEF